MKEPFVTVTPPQEKRLARRSERMFFHQEHKDKRLQITNNYILHIIEKLTYNTV